MKRYIIGITGASGSIYGKRIIEEISKTGNETELVFTKNGKDVFLYETGYDIENFTDELCKNGAKININSNNDLFSSIASGSYKFEAMIIVPCSMGTLAKISYGISDSLICRAADVTLKEKRKLIIVPRETPLSEIHIENMLRLSRAGAVIIPPVPSFYGRPSTVEDIVNNTVGRIMYSAGIENKLYTEWGEK